MSTIFEIPLNAQSQRFACELAGATYNLQIVWNAKSNCWVLDINDADNEPLMRGIPLVTGLDLLQQYAYFELGGFMLTMTDAAPDVPPTYQNLGGSGHLYFITVP